MNLHLMLDEKVINRTIHYFEEALPGDNKYIITVEKGLSPKLVDINSNNVISAEFGCDSFWRFIGDTNQYDNIIIHYLTPDFVRFVLHLSKTSNVVWIVWGADFYVDMLSYRGYRLYANPEDVYQEKSHIRRIIDGLIDYYSYLRKVRAVSRIPSVVMFNGDYQLLLSYYPQMHPKRLDFFYYPIDDLIGKGLIGSYVTDNNIFVGNSASYTNNHRMVFEKLSKCELKGRKVYVPLSYGDAKDSVLAYGEKLLKKHFYPITEFMPLDHYNKLMLNSNVFIYGNFRQEAWGNIIVALYIGGSVVLHPRNPLLDDLRLIGLKLFVLDDLEYVLKNSISEDDRQRNRRIIEEKYSKKRLLELIRTSFG